MEDTADQFNMVHQEIARLKRQVRRLRWWNIGFCLLVLGAVLIWRSMARWDEQMRAVDAYWDGDTLRLSTMLGEPVVVTHLMASGACAQLPESIVITDSGGPTFDRGMLNRLAWKNGEGGKTTAPRRGDFVEALYYRPSVSEWRKPY